MIQYALKCADGHTFDSWFQSAAAYERLEQAGMVACAVCGGGGVEKAMMTPRVGSAREEVAPSAQLRDEPNLAETAMTELRRRIEKDSEYVGGKFASEARAMHLGDIPHRSIYGEARLEEARQLAEDGVPVAPLPFVPTRKAN